MNEKPHCFIEIDAVRALIQWKSLFASELSRQAQQLLAESDEPPVVTLEHYRRAAEMVLPMLAEAIKAGRDGDANQKAA